MSPKILSPGYTFDDLLLIPQKSEVLPADVSVATQLTPNLALDLPIVAADMDTVTESGLAIALAQKGGVGIIHKNLTPDEQAAEVVIVKEKDLPVGASVGVGEDFEERLKKLTEAKVDFVAISTAHGHSAGVIKAVARVRQKYPDLDIIAGNVVTAAGAQDLIDAGASAIKVGVGPGSICTTRVIAGVGMPQLTAIMDVATACQKEKIPLIADGGIKYSGDVVKALAAGAGTVMLGSLLAGTDESPGKIVTIEGKEYKAYRGMGSEGALTRGSKDRYGQLGAGKLVPEGVEAAVPAKGPLKDVIYQLIGGLRSGMGYLGAKDLTELKKRAVFVPISGSGLRESHPHDVQIIKKAINY